jgi:hypothetical protein
VHHTAAELAAMGCTFPATSCSDLYEAHKDLHGKGSCGLLKSEDIFTKDMHAQAKRCVGCNKGTIIGVTVGGVFVLAFAAVGTFKLLKFYGCLGRARERHVWEGNEGIPGTALISTR